MAETVALEVGLEMGTKILNGCYVMPCFRTKYHHIEAPTTSAIDNFLQMIAGQSSVAPTPLHIQHIPLITPQVAVGMDKADAENQGR